MINVLGLTAFLMLLLLGRLPQNAAHSVRFDNCGDDEDVKPPVIRSEECWSRSLHRTLEDCYCGEGYYKNAFGKCEGCSEGFSRNEDNNCVHCPDNNERWCHAYQKCICLKDFYPHNGKCLPCDDNEISDGVSACECMHEYLRNSDGECERCNDHETWNLTNKQCICDDGYARSSLGACQQCPNVRHVYRYNRVFEECICTDDCPENENDKIKVFTNVSNIHIPILSFIVIVFLGFICGYAIRKYMKK